MKEITKIRKMTSDELANFFHYKITSSDCSDCILNNLGKMEFCKNTNCCQNIKDWLESEVNK